MHVFFHNNMLIRHALPLVSSPSFFPLVLMFSAVDYCSPFDATVVRLLRGAGAHVIGKANCDEFGMG